MTYVSGWAGREKTIVRGNHHYEAVVYLGQLPVRIFKTDIESCVPEITRTAEEFIDKHPDKGYQLKLEENPHPSRRTPSGWAICLDNKL